MKFKVGDKVRVTNNFGAREGYLAALRDTISDLKKEFKELSERVEDIQTNITALAFEANGIKKDEPKTWQFTDDEKVILRNLPEEYKWIARDENGCLSVCDTAPIKLNYHEWGDSLQVRNLKAFEHLFQSIQWADETPCEFRKFI